MVQQIYKVFIGILLAATIGFGIATFYPAPEHPRFDEPEMHRPKSLDTPAAGPTEEDMERQREHERQYEAYQEAAERHHRNTAIIAVVAALAVLAVSLTALSNVSLIADGMLLGGIFTLIYGIVRSFGSDNRQFMFAVTLVGLITAIVIGHLRFVVAPKNNHTRPKAKSRK